MPIAELLSRWVLSQGASTILEPSCGDGVFLRALYAEAITGETMLRISLDAVEIEEEEAAKSERVSEQLRGVGINTRVIRHDIFSWLDTYQAACQWDAILGNPPYIRYQYFEKDQRELAEQLFKRACVPFSRRTNAWVALALACVMRLKAGGSLALVLPAELLYIQHAGGLRQLLEREMETITLINIREMVFPDVLQGVILLLARKKRAQTLLPLAPQEIPADVCCVQRRLNGAQLSTVQSAQVSSDLDPTTANPRELSISQPAQASSSYELSASIRLLDLDNLASLTTLSLSQLEVSSFQPMSDTHGEWMLGLLSEEERSLLRRLRAHQAVQPFAALASVDIGMVTGANNFFVVDQETLERFGLAPIASPMLAKSELIKGITYTLSDHETNRAAGKAVFFLAFPARAVGELPASMAAYISNGEIQKLPERYKCRIRSPWYVVPYTWTAELALLKRCHLFPRLVVNELRAHSTDTAYRIRLHAHTAGRARDLACSFLNSLTFLCAELDGRHYGGGVLELVPSEIEKLLIPLQPVAESLFARVDTMLRQRVSFNQLLSITDPLLLGQGLGLTEQEIQLIQTAHQRLLKRRLRT